MRFALGQAEAPTYPLPFLWKRAEGKEQGLIEGREQGLAEGKEQGRTEGREEGEIIGYNKALSELLSLGVIQKEDLSKLQNKVEIEELLK